MPASSVLKKKTTLDSVYIIVSSREVCKESQAVLANEKFQMFFATIHKDSMKQQCILYSLKK